MNERDLKCEAMMHMEVAMERLWEVARILGGPDVGKLDATDELELIALTTEVERRNAAAHYMVQAMNGGPRPDNFDNIIAKARWYDAKADAEELIEFAKRGVFRGE